MYQPASNSGLSRTMRSAVSGVEPGSGTGIQAPRLGANPVVRAAFGAVDWASARVLPERSWAYVRARLEKASPQR